MKSPVRALLGAFTVSLIIASTAGCGGAAESGRDGAAVRVGLSSKSPTMLALFAAIKNGYFTEEGVDVPEPTILPSGAKLAAAVLGGSIDVGIGVTPDVLNLAQTGKPVKIIGAVYPSYYVDVVAGGGITVPDGADVDTKIKALKGKKIGITGPGSGTEALITYLFRRAGLQAGTDAQLVSLGSDPSAAINALKSGQVDALSHILSVGQQAEATGIGHIFVSPGRGDVSDLKGALHGVAFTLQPMIDDHRPEVAKFLRALQRGLDFVHNDPTAARAILAEQFSGMSPPVIDAVAAVVAANTATTLTVDPHGYEVESRMLLDTGLVKSAPELEKILAADLIREAAGTPGK